MLIDYFCRAISLVTLLNKKHMKRKHSIQIACFFLATLVLFTGCASTTMIQSTPPGADVYVSQQKMGVTPYAYTDSKIVGSSTPFVLKKEGYQDLNVVITRTEQADVGAIIGGIFVLIPFLWVCKYNPEHNYTLTPAAPATPAVQQTVPVPVTPAPPVAPAVAPNAATPATGESDKSATELYKLKTLSENGTITSDEYTTLKSKVLDNKYDYANSPADQLTKLKSWLDQGLISQNDFNSKKRKVIYGQ